MRFALPITLLMMVLTLAGCPGGGERAGRVVADTIDCTTAAAKEAMGELGPALSDVVRNATSPDGDVDGARLKAIGSSLVRPAAQCAMVSVLAELMRPAPASADEPKAAGLEPNPEQLHGVLEELRASWGGQHYALEAGTL